MQIVEIDLDKLRSSGLYVEDFIILKMISEGVNPDSLNWFNCASGGLKKCPHCAALEQNLWIKPTDSGYELRQKGRDLFVDSESLINFDEFFENFPHTTPSGRVLRAKNKLFGGVPSRDYVVCKKKYLDKVRTLELHRQAVEIIKARVASKDYEYINNLETYINQRKWEQDVKYLTVKPRINGGTIFTLAGENK